MIVSIFTVVIILVNAYTVVGTGVYCAYSYQCVNTFEICDFYTNRCICMAGYSANGNGVCISNGLSVLGIALLCSFLSIGLLIVLAVILICYRRRQARYPGMVIGQSGLQVHQVEQPTTIYQTMPSPPAYQQIGIQKGNLQPPPYQS
ncbi:Uncharacterised protein g9346 [Pycnogonum litorale]